MNKFSMGAVAGAASLLVAVPLLAQFAGAQSVSSSSATGARPVPTQACVQAMSDMEAAHLADFDTESATRKAELQKRSDALKSAAAIADDTQREAALKALRQDRPTPPTPSDAVTKAMDAVKTACGDTMMFRGGFGGPMHGGMFRMKANLAEKFGMTEDELKAALDSGKTIEQIAQEKGITLPAHPHAFMRGMKFGSDKEQDTTADTDNQ